MLKVRRNSSLGYQRLCCTENDVASLKKRKVKDRKNWQIQ